MDIDDVKRELLKRVDPVKGLPREQMTYDEIHTANELVKEGVLTLQFSEKEKTFVYFKRPIYEGAHNHGVFDTPNQIH